MHCLLWERLCELRVWIKKRMKNVTLGDRQTDTHVNIELEFYEQNSQIRESFCMQSIPLTGGVRWELPINVNGNHLFNLWAAFSNLISSSSLRSWSFVFWWKLKRGLERKAQHWKYSNGDSEIAARCNKIWMRKCWTWICAQRFVFLHAEGIQT